MTKNHLCNWFGQVTSEKKAKNMLIKRLKDYYSEELKKEKR